MFTHYIKSNGSDDVGDCWGLVSVANLFFSTLLILFRKHVPIKLIRRLDWTGL